MKNKSFTLIEALIYIFVFSLISILVFSFLFWLFQYESRIQEKTEILLNNNMALNFISEKTKSAKSIYYLTCSENQLSLQINQEYIDFYSCNNDLCFKQEFKEPIVLLPNVDYLEFEFIGEKGVKINLNELTTTIYLR